MTLFLLKIRLVNHLLGILPQQNLQQVCNQIVHHPHFLPQSHTYADRKEGLLHEVQCKGLHDRPKAPGVRPSGQWRLYSHTLRAI